jgi:hypothetical protein
VLDAVLITALVLLIHGLILLRRLRCLSVQAPAAHQQRAQSYVRNRSHDVESSS